MLVEENQIESDWTELNGTEVKVKIFNNRTEERPLYLWSEPWLSYRSPGTDERSINGFPFLTSRNWKRSHLSCHVDSFPSYRGSGQTQFSHSDCIDLNSWDAIGSSPGKQVVIDFYLAGSHWPWDASEKSRWYSSVTGPVSWNFLTQQRQSSSSCWMGCFVALPKEFYTNMDLNKKQRNIE